MTEYDTIPHSVIAEKDVVGCIFQEPSLLAEVPFLSEDHFYLPGPRTLFRVISHFIATGKPMDTRALLDHLNEKDLLQRIGGPVEIAKLLEAMPTSERFLHFVATLNDKLARRMAIKAADGIKEAAYQSDSANELIEATSAPINAIQDAILAAKPAESIRKIMSDINDEIVAKLSGKKESMGIKTSIPVFDRKLLGLHPGRTTIISGYPSGGKSVMASQFCAEAALQNRNTLFVSLEMSKVDLQKRMLAYVSGLDGDAINDPLEYSMARGRESMSKQELIAIQSAAKKIVTSPYDIERLSGANESIIAAVIRKHHRKSPLSLVAVDYAQRIRPSSDTKGQSREQQLSHSSKVLADLAGELGFHLLFLSQLNKEGAAKGAEALNEDCDLHLSIVQNSTTKEHIGVSVVKDRHHGQMGSLFNVRLNPSKLRFEEFEPNRNQ